MIETIDAFDFEITEFDFDSFALSEITKRNLYVSDLWPSVYILISNEVMEAYVGESANIVNRLKNHLTHIAKSKLNKVFLITSPSFNKSATLDIESNLIKYFDADERYKLLNGNAGLASQNYYQKSLYGKVFIDIWGRLQTQQVTKAEISKLNNSDYFKYSPYKSLTAEQLESVTTILELLVNRDKQSIFIKGSAGTGKTIVGIYLMKLLLTDISIYEDENLDEDTLYLLELVKRYKQKVPNPKLALVVPMTSLRDTLKKVFKGIKGLGAKNVIGPSQISDGNYDVLLIDEAHRLKRRKGITNYRSHDDMNRLLGFDEEGTELDWILKQSDNQLFFYDPLQSIRPSDIPKERFDSLLRQSANSLIELKSQMRVLAGVDYIDFVDRLLEGKLKEKELFVKNSQYQFYLFDDLAQMIGVLRKKEEKDGLSRLTAGFAWPWESRAKDIHDIEIQGLKLNWNRVTSNWINSENAFSEVGCIHTTQGYDLNYTGVIFGGEISYDPVKKEIIIKKENYFDRNGKAGVEDPEILKEYILNIYKTLMYRGIKGTYVYIVDKELRKYIGNHIMEYKYA
ncbi:DUF2075 domain-containing protein [Flavobacterium silvaticum]|uniref:DUF2075 domain-containing protein n=1 Tax=Flavobacterium silvaticum TaxID=1852020 RepID=A0A972JG64_9FLAO|nr:DUF2075 domain-containing protein [Flavobacterium silvaticum]NMH28724.1 DUF2075 domain-containing protein [Flavobacterium silvaticum]